jgi:hypothetical protein
VPTGREAQILVARRDRATSIDQRSSTTRVRKMAEKTQFGLLLLSFSRSGACARNIDNPKPAPRHNP